MICDRDETRKYEQAFIDRLKPEYNTATDALAPMLGKKFSKSHRNKISKALSGENNPMHGMVGKRHPMYGEHHSEETKRKMKENHADVSGKNNPMYGKIFTEEHRRKISEAQIGKVLTPEHLANMSKAVSGEKNAMYGKKHTKESRRKISANRVYLNGKDHPGYGKYRSDETKRKLSEAQKGEKSYMYGRHHSEETKAKMSASMKAYWKRIKESQQTR